MTIHRLFSFTCPHVSTVWSCLLNIPCCDLFYLNFHYPFFLKGFHYFIISAIYVGFVYPVNVLFPRCYMKEQTNLGGLELGSWRPSACVSTPSCHHTSGVAWARSTVSSSLGFLFSLTPGVVTRSDELSHAVCL